MSRIKILIADDHHVVRSGLRALLESTKGFNVVAEAVDGEEAVQRAAQCKPDVAILDISMPRMNGVDAAKLIKQESPSTRILMLTIHESEEYLYQVIRAGVDGYVLKNADREELSAAVRTVTGGKPYFSSGVSDLILADFARRVQEENSPGSRGGERALTRRETEVLRGIAQGKTNKAIAADLFLSVRTVDTHRTNLMQKLDIHETAGLVRYAIQIGLVDASA